MCSLLAFRAGEYSENLRRTLSLRPRGASVRDWRETRNPVQATTYHPASGSLPRCSFRNMLSPLLTQSVGEWRPARTKCLQRPGRGLKAEGTGGSRSPPQLDSSLVTQSSSQGHLPEAGEVSEVGMTCVCLPSHPAKASVHL